MYKNLVELFQKHHFKRLILGGECFPKSDLIKELILKGTKIYNVYGITELSCWSSCHLVDINDFE